MNLATLAAQVDDTTVLGLIVRMTKNGQAATRKGDAEAVAKFERAYSIYYAEAVKRGLVGRP